MTPVTNRLRSVAIDLLCTGRLIKKGNRPKGSLASAVLRSVGRHKTKEELCGTIIQKLIDQDKENAISLMRAYRRSLLLL